MKAITAAALLAVAPAYAQMYKCVDERGVTNYSDKPRPGCKGGPVDIRGSPAVSGSVAPAAASDLARQDAEFKRRQIEREKAEAEQRTALAERCAALRQEFAVYANVGRIVRMDAGKPVYMDDATREARVAALKEQLRACP